MNYPPSTSKPPVRCKNGAIVRGVLLVLSTLLCLGGAAAMFYRATLSPSYETQAKLLVRYLLERSTVDSYESRVDTSGALGIDVMNAEIEIIKSADMALEVATKIGPEKILVEKDLPPAKAAAAAQIASNLDVRTTPGSSIIHLAYHHPDPEVAVAVLKQLIDSYFERHLEIHRNTGDFESVARQTDQARSRLSQTEAELSKLSSDSGFLSIADAKTILEARRNALRTSLMSAQVELAAQQVKVASLKASMGVAPPAPPKADDKAPDGATTGGDSPAARMEQAKPEGGSPQPPATDLNVERANLESLEAKNKLLIDQLAKVDAEVEKISSKSLEFANLERRRQLEEEKYRHSEAALDKARLDEILNPASMPNISVVQNPSAPVRSPDGTSTKIAVGLAACGLLLLLTIAFGGKPAERAGGGPGEQGK